MRHSIESPENTHLAAMPAALRKEACSSDLPGMFASSKRPPLATAPRLGARGWPTIYWGALTNTLLDWANRRLAYGGGSTAVTRQIPDFPRHPLQAKPPGSGGLTLSLFVFGGVGCSPISTGDESRPSSGHYEHRCWYAAIAGPALRAAEGNTGPIGNGGCPCFQRTLR